MLKKKAYFFGTSFKFREKKLVRCSEGSAWRVYLLNLKKHVVFWVRIHVSIFRAGSLTVVPDAGLAAFKGMNSMQGHLEHTRQLDKNKRQEN